VGRGLTLVLALALCWPAYGRSAAVLLAFKRENPCPSTGERRGPCPGWQIDHKKPLCLQGLDALSNLQWLTVTDHQAKTRQDMSACRALKSQPQP
jgi:hypothetical protein